MKRSAPLRRSPFPSGKKRKPRPSLTEFHAAVCADGACALGYLGGCEGRLWGHHYVPKQRLKHLPDAYVDPRNGVPCCVVHHAQIEARRIVCPRPPYLDDFLADYGLADPDGRRGEKAA